MLIEVDKAQDDFLKQARNGKGHFAIAYALLEVASQVERLAVETDGIGQMIDKTGGEIQHRVGGLAEAITGGCDMIAEAMTNEDKAK